MTWFDDNERKAYPLTGEDDGAIPQDVLVDVLVHAPVSLGTRLELTSMVVSRLIVSVVFSIAGTPVAYATVPNTDDLVQAETPLNAITAGVSGFVVLGSGIRRELLNVSGSYPVLDSCVILFQSAPTTPTLTVQGRELFGQVILEAGTDVTITAEDVSIQGVGTKRAAVFRLSSTVRGDPVGAAFRSAEADLATPAVRLINGCPPPLALAVVVIKELPTEASVTVTPDVPNHAIAFIDGGEPCS